MTQSDRVRIGKITDTANKLLRYVHDNAITENRIREEFAVQWTITTPLYNIGEHTYHISKELKETYPEVPWSQIAGMRHRLVHQYEDTNWDIICDVVFFQLQAYVEQLMEILSGE